MKDILETSSWTLSSAHIPKMATFNAYVLASVIFKVKNIS